MNVFRTTNSYDVLMTIAGLISSVISCVRPVLFETDLDDAPYAGQGTCFLVRLKSELFVVTALHVVGNVLPATLRIFPDGSDVSLGLERQSSVADRVRIDDDFADIICFRIDRSELCSRKGTKATLLNLDRPLVPPASGARMVVLGYPDQSRGIDYEACVIRTTGEMIGAEYIGPSISENCHELRLTDIGTLQHMSGFSGSPVFFADKDREHGAALHLVGMLLRSTFESKRGHYLDLGVVRTLVNRCHSQNDLWP